MTLGVVFPKNDSNFILPSAALCPNVEIKSRPIFHKVAQKVDKVVFTRKGLPGLNYPKVT